MKKHVMRLLALVMTLTVVLSTTMVSSMAASVVRSKRTVKNFVYIGDSIASGWTLDNDNPDNPYTMSNQMHHTHDEVVKGSWPWWVAKRTRSTDVFKLAREGYSTVNILRIIDPEYDQEEMAQPENYYDRYFSACMFWNSMWKCSNPDPTETIELKASAQRAIADADVIAVEIGNNDVLTNSVLDPFIRYWYYAYGIAAQAYLTTFWDGYAPVVSPVEVLNRINTIDSLEELVQMVGGYELISDRIDDNWEAFKPHFERIIKRIRELNPDAEIYVLGAYNVFGQDSPKNEVQQSLEEMNVDLIEKAEKFYTKESKYANTINYVDIRDAEVWSSDEMTNARYWLRFVYHQHPTFEGHAYIANQLIRAINANN